MDTVTKLGAVEGDFCIIGEWLNIFQDRWSASLRMEALLLCDNG